MNDKKKARGTHCEFPLEDDMCLGGNAVSTTDCTGMIPSGSVDSSEKYEKTNETRRYGAERR